MGGCAQVGPCQDGHHRPDRHHRQVRLLDGLLQTYICIKCAKEHVYFECGLMKAPAACRAALDEDTPAFGKNYCTTCSRYFVTPHALTTHSKSKDHKRRSAVCTPVSADVTGCQYFATFITHLSMQLQLGASRLQG